MNSIVQRHALPNGMASRAEALDKDAATDEVRTLPATGPQYAANPANWINAFWLAIACREPERLTALAQVPLELLRAPGAGYDEYVYPWIETLQTWWLRGGDLSVSLDAAIAGTDPEGLEGDDRDLMLRILRITSSHGAGSGSSTP
ncbi:immunity 49 family protein [Streptomyces sp. NBC_00091]|uniref:immunity 49 family protein n=1 Tax=Streptomyces sp. NBC_00091 TaxID=2975648 RepID=UPI002257BF95|nr:immunity 49 family protein [Streptomyces sp. NBC_00091]MCX5376725.1 immunity 49 family protein [Streptomyces sp. NBC_00091]